MSADGGRGDSWEYLGSREYQVGMPVRRWDYGAWARLGKPVVREFEEHSRSRACVLVDTAVLPEERSSSARRAASRDATAPHSATPQWRLETALSLAAAVANGLAETGWRIDAVATESCHVDAAVHEVDVPRWMLRLGAATPQLDAHWREMCDQATRHGPAQVRSQTMFVVLSAWDRERRQGVKQLRKQYGDVRVLAPAPLEAPGDVTVVNSVPRPHFLERSRRVTGAASAAAGIFQAAKPTPQARG